MLLSLYITFAPEDSIFQVLLPLYLKLAPEEEHLPGVLGSSGQLCPAILCSPPSPLLCEVAVECGAVAVCRHQPGREKNIKLAVFSVTEKHLF